MLFASALAFALAAPGQAGAPTPAVAVAIDPARRILGLELAQLLNSDAMSRAQIDHMLSETFPAALAADAAFKELEKDYPGISRATLDAMRPIVTAEVVKGLPTLWNSLGAIYAEEFTEGELNEVLAFFRSPAGGRVIENMAREVTFGAELQAMLASEQNDISETAMRTGLAAGAVKAVRKLSEEDRKAVAAFGWTPAGAKLAATKKRILPVLTAWSNQTSPETDARMEKAMTEVIEKFIGKDTPK